MQELRGPDFRSRSEEWDLGQATNKVTASTFMELQDGSVVVDPRTTILININAINHLLKSESTLYNRKNENIYGIGADYNIKHSAPIVQDFSLCCRGGKILSSGDYDGYPVSNAFDNDFATTRWAGRDVGPSIYRKGISLVMILARLTGEKLQPL